MFRRLFPITDSSMSNKAKLDDIILNIQNVALFGISLYSLYCCVNYLIITSWTYVSSNEDSCFAVNSLSHCNTDNYIRPFDNLLFVVQFHAHVGN